MQVATFDELGDMIYAGSDEVCTYIRAHPESAQLRDEDSMAKYHDGNTLLHVACCYKRLKVVQALLAVGAVVNDRGVNGRTPLHWAVHEGDASSVPIVEVLLQHGADRSILDDHGYSPADWAKVEIDEGLPEVLDLLESTGSGADESKP
jgi:ankyrin repeat protein